MNHAHRHAHLFAEKQLWHWRAQNRYIWNTHENFNFENGSWDKQMKKNWNIPAFHKVNNFLGTYLNLDNWCWIVSPCSNINFINCSMDAFDDFGWTVLDGFDHVFVDRCRFRRTIALSVLDTGLSLPLS